MTPYKHTNTKGITYILHKKAVTLRGGMPMTIYFFAKTEGGKGEPCELPEGYEPVENMRNGFLTIRKKDKAKKK